MIAQLGPEPIVIATTNPHKIKEIRSIFGPLGIEVIGLGDLPGGTDLPEPVEDGVTFEENARLKAVGYASLSGRPCLADDSGLEVDALGGQPGVLSARFAGIGGSREERDRANNLKLLRELQGVSAQHRTARFVCAMCIAAPDGTIIVTSRGEFPGVIGFEPRGSNGFGYDPLLMLPDGRTSAEMDPEEKNARSHRGRAARAILSELLGPRSPASTSMPNNPPR